MSVKFDWLDAFTGASGMPPSRQLVGLHMWKFAGNDGTSVRPSIAQLCQRSGYGRHTVIDARRDLIAAGWFVLEKQGSNVKGNRAALLSLAIPASAASALPGNGGSAASAPGSAASAPPGVQPVHQGSALSGTLSPSLSVSSSSSPADDDDDSKKRIPRCELHPFARERLTGYLGTDDIRWESLERRLGAELRAHRISMDLAAVALFHDTGTLREMAGADKPGAVLMKRLPGIVADYARSDDYRRDRESEVA